MASGWVFIKSPNFAGPDNAIMYKKAGSYITGSENLTYAVAPSAADEDIIHFTGSLAAGFAGSMLDGNHPTISKDAYVLDGYYSIVYGPISVSADVTVTVGEGAHVKVLDWASV